MVDLDSQGKFHKLKWISVWNFAGIWDTLKQVKVYNNFAAW